MNCIKSVLCVFLSLCVGVFVGGLVFTATLILRVIYQYYFGSPLDSLGIEWISPLAGLAGGVYAVYFTLTYKGKTKKRGYRVLFFVVGLLSVLQVLGFFYGVYVYFKSFPHEWEAFVDGGESLYDCDFVLSTDKDVYAMGDCVRLKLRIIPEAKRNLSLSENLYNAISLGYEFNDGLSRFYDKGAKVTYELSPETPLEFEIFGAIYKDEEGKIWLDFHEFGKAAIHNGSFHKVSFGVSPYYYEFLDSVEWGGSNELEICLVDQNI